MGLVSFKGGDFDKELNNKAKHQEIVLAKYRLFCGQRNAEVMFTVCKAKRQREECQRICSEAKKFMGI